MDRIEDIFYEEILPVGLNPKKYLQHIQQEIVEIRYILQALQAALTAEQCSSTRKDASTVPGADGVDANKFLSQAEADEIHYLAGELRYRGDEIIRNWGEAYSGAVDRLIRGADGVDANRVDIAKAAMREWLQRGEADE